MSNIIIELSNKSADKTTVNNGDFTCSFPPVQINNSDFISIKNTYIDTIQQNYDQIYIEADTLVSMKFCYYETIAGDMYDIRRVNVSTNAKAVTVPNDMYFMFDATNNLKIGEKTFTLKKGVYTPDSLAIELTKLMTATDISNNVFIRQPVNDLGQFVGLPMIRPTNQFVVSTLADGTENLPGYNNTVSLSRFCYFDQVAGTIRVGSAVPGTKSEAYRYTMYNGPSNQYDVQEILTGAQQVSLVFNNENNNKFSFEYLHTPLYGAQFQEMVGVYVWHDAQSAKEWAITRDTGVIFTDLQPRSLWSSLGFDLNSVCMQYNRDSTNGDINVLNFNNNTQTTETIFSLASAFPNPSRLMNDTNYWFTSPNFNDTKWYYKTSDLTRSIDASQFFSFQNLSPFIMIELICNYKNEYVAGDGKSNFIQGIVSRNYTSNNFITGYSDSGITYQHKGSSFLLSSIRVRILSPDTKELERNLGNNNYIILNIQKNSSS